MTVVNFYVVGVKLIMQKGARLDAVGNIQIIIVFAHTRVSMELDPRI